MIVRRRDSESGAGTTGNVTFKASDGVNIVSFVSTFTVSSNAIPFSGTNGTNYGIFGINSVLGFQDKPDQIHLELVII